MSATVPEQPHYPSNVGFEFTRKLVTVFSGKDVLIPAGPLAMRHHAVHVLHGRVQMPFAPLIRIVGFAGTRKGHCGACDRRAQFRHTSTEGIDVVKQGERVSGQPFSLIDSIRQSREFLDHLFINRIADTQLGGLRFAGGTRDDGGTGNPLRRLGRFFHIFPPRSTSFLPLNKITSLE